MSITEANLDGLVGPTHNYAGLAYGNEASQKNAGLVSNPRMAALQGLSKMRLLHDLGLPQFVMPPHPRPDALLLDALGFEGDMEHRLGIVARFAPGQLLPLIYSASGMWAANAATVCASADAADGKMHFTPANLSGTAHRAGEAAFAAQALKKIFADANHFTHHAPLPPGPMFADEGAANHMRLQLAGGAVHLFVYGREGGNPLERTRKFPARQAAAASQSVARLHRLSPESTAFFRQNPDAIDAGVFHNDVIATSNGNLLLCHEQAFADRDTALNTLRGFGDIFLLEVKTGELSLEEAVATYLFNSQIVSAPEGMVMLAPSECEENPRTRTLIERWCADAANPIARAIYVDVRESMRNGGGPACLRLRLPMTQAELSAAHPGCRFTSELHTALEAWVKAHYRDRLAPEDLRDPALAGEAWAALRALENILQLPGLYDAFA